MVREVSSLDHELLDDCKKRFTFKLPWSSLTQHSFILYDLISVFYSAWTRRFLLRNIQMLCVLYHDMALNSDFACVITWTHTPEQYHLKWNSASEWPHRCFKLNRTSFELFNYELQLFDFTVSLQPLKWHITCRCEGYLLLWNGHPLKCSGFPVDLPMPFSPVQSARKFSAVLGVISANSSRTIRPAGDRKQLNNYCTSSVISDLG